MDKSKILAQAQRQKRDEGATHAWNKGLQLGYLWFLILVILLNVFNLITGEVSSDMLALSWAFYASTAYSKFKFDGKKRYLVICIFAILVCLMNITLHIRKVLGLI